MIYTIKKAINKFIQKISMLLEYVFFASLKKYSFASWHGGKVSDHDETTKGIHTKGQRSGEIEWKSDQNVEYSGVCVLSSVKLLMCRPLEVHQRHPSSRKAIACTRNYRPLKYPGAQSLLVSLAFIRRNLGYWLKKEGHGTLSGNVALLGNSVFDNANYYHFWIDVIADIWYIRQHLPEKDLPDYYLVPHSNMSWQWDVLNLCGVQESQVIPYTRHDVFSLEKLSIPVRDKGAVNLPPWLCRAMHDMCEWEPRSEKGERLIFVSRADADRRRVANEEVIRERLRDKGFEVHTLNGLSVKEQQQLFASAAIICAPHGAALTNLVWCGPGTVIIDFLSERHLIPCFHELAAQNRLFYYPYACKQVGNVASGIKSDIIVADAQVESVLDIVAQHAPQAGYLMAGQDDNAPRDKSAPIS